MPPDSDPPSRIEFTQPANGSIDEADTHRFSSVGKEIGRRSASHGAGDHRSGPPPSGTPTPVQSHLAGRTIPHGQRGGNPPAHPLIPRRFPDRAIALNRTSLEVGLLKNRAHTAVPRPRWKPASIFQSYREGDWETGFQREIFNAIALGFQTSRPGGRASPLRIVRPQRTLQTRPAESSPLLISYHVPGFPPGSAADSSPDSGFPTPDSRRSCENLIFEIL